MARFTVRVVDREAKPQNACFDDFAGALTDALRILGFAGTSSDPGRLILFGANDVNSTRRIPASAVLYNAEQLAGKVDPRRLIAGVPNSQVVWDYSETNLSELRTLGIERAIHCPIGYVSSMTTIASVSDEDIDVLFYGWVNERRAAILDALEGAGLRVVRLFGPFGAERDRYIARAKVVLNLHFYEESVFEIFRCSHLFANRKCVVTEDGGRDETLEDLARRACVYASRGEIVDACRSLVANARSRNMMAERGYEAFRKTDLVENVHQAIKQSTFGGEKIV